MHVQECGLFLKNEWGELWLSHKCVGRSSRNFLLRSMHVLLNGCDAAG